MTTIISKHSRLLPEESDPLPPPQVSGLDDSDVDLIDKIKAAITKLKNTKQRSNQLKFKTIKFPCSVCDKNCNVNQDAIYCTQCELWVHHKCNGTSKQEYAKLSNEADDAPFQCLLCIMKENSEIVPFFFLDTHELLDLNGIDLPSQPKPLGSYELKSRLKTMPNFTMIWMKILSIQ